MIQNLLKSGVVKPTMAFALLKNELEKQAGEKLKAFKVTHIVDSDRIVVDIQRESKPDKPERYSHEDKNNMLTKMIGIVAKKEIQTGSLDAFEIFFGEQSYLKVLFTDSTDEKHIKQIML